MATEPTVEMEPSKYDGRYRIARQPSRMKPHNAESWAVVNAILEGQKSADFRDLAVAVRNHLHYGTDPLHPQNFIAYCIRSGWLEAVQ
jgi:hypothetical protein